MMNTRKRKYIRASKRTLRNHPKNTSLLPFSSLNKYKQRDYYESARLEEVERLEKKMKILLRDVDFKNLSNQDPLIEIINTQYEIKMIKKYVPIYVTLHENVYNKEKFHMNKAIVGFKLPKKKASYITFRFWYSPENRSYFLDEVFYMDSNMIDTIIKKSPLMTQGVYTIKQNTIEPYI